MSNPRFFPAAETPSFAISIADTANQAALAPMFSVTLNTLTVNTEYEKYAEQFKSGRVHGVSFEIKSISTLEISIEPVHPFSAADMEFRKALNRPTRYLFTLAEMDKVIAAYETYLAQNKLQSSHKAKVADPSSGSKPSSNFSF